MKGFVCSQRILESFLSPNQRGSFSTPSTRDSQRVGISWRRAHLFFLLGLLPWLFTHKSMERSPHFNSPPWVCFSMLGLGFLLRPCRDGAVPFFVMRFGARSSFFFHGNFFFRGGSYEKRTFFPADFLPICFVELFLRRLLSEVGLRRRKEPFELELDLRARDA